MNGTPLHRLTFEELYSDRCNHRYTIRIDSGDMPLTLALDNRVIRRYRLRRPCFRKVVVFSEQRRRAEAEHAAEEARRAARQQAAADADRFSEIVEALSIRAERTRIGRTRNIAQTLLGFMPKSSSSAKVKSARIQTNFLSNTGSHVSTAASSYGPRYAAAVLNRCC